MQYVVKSVISNQYSVISGATPITDYRSLITDYRLLITELQPLAINHFFKEVKHADA